MILRIVLGTRRGDGGCFGTYAWQPLRWCALVADTLQGVYARMRLHGTRNRSSLGPPSDGTSAPARTSSARTEQEKHR